MKDPETEKLLKATIRHFGIEHQISKAKEEMCELIIELERRQDGRTNEERICEEIADSYITNQQLMMIYGREKVMTYVEAKLKRLEERLNGKDN